MPIPIIRTTVGIMLQGLLFTCCGAQEVFPVVISTDSAESVQDIGIKAESEPSGDFRWVAYAYFTPDTSGEENEAEAQIAIDRLAPIPNSMANYFFGTMSKGVLTVVATAKRRWEHQCTIDQCAFVGLIDMSPMDDYRIRWTHVLENQNQLQDVATSCDGEAFVFSASPAATQVDSDDNSNQGKGDDVYWPIAIYDSNKGQSWSSDNIGDVQMTDIYVVPQCALIATGSFRGTVGFDSAVEVSAAIGVREMFVAKYSTCEEKLIWAKTITGSAATQGDIVVNDAHDNTFVGGHFSDGVGTWLKPNEDEMEIIAETSDSSGSGSAFIISYDADGKYRGGKILEGNTFIKDISVSSYDEVNVIYTRDSQWERLTIDFGDDVKTENWVPWDGMGKGEGEQVAALSDEQWVVLQHNQFGPSQIDDFDISASNCLGIEGTCDVIGRLTRNAEDNWARAVAGKLEKNAAIKDFTVAGSDTIVAVGDFHGKVLFQNSENAETSASLNTGMNDIFVVSYNADGELIGLTSIDQDAPDRPDCGASAAHSVVSLSDGSVIIAGTMEGKLVFKRGKPDETTAGENGKKSLFFANYKI